MRPSTVPTIISCSRSRRCVMHRKPPAAASACVATRFGARTFGCESIFDRSNENIDVSIEMECTSDEHVLSMAALVVGSLCSCICATSSLLERLHTRTTESLPAVRMYLSQMRTVCTAPWCPLGIVQSNSAWCPRHARQRMRPSVQPLSTVATAGSANSSKHTDDGVGTSAAGPPPCLFVVRSEKRLTAWYDARSHKRMRPSREALTKTSGLDCDTATSVRPSSGDSVAIVWLKSLTRMR
mmetsp:Transcript_31015/g.95808  ORF Transcript_31015/g.95808 Transcript_31015/m.95808 type:complete len:240 (-) Transcript_31015:1199-1918(-)